MTGDAPAFDSFDYHAPDPGQALALQTNRDAAKAMRAVLLVMPPSRERSLAITALEESLMWANKAALVPQPPPPR